MYADGEQPGAQLTRHEQEPILRRIREKEELRPHEELCVLAMLYSNTWLPFPAEFNFPPFYRLAFFCGVLTAARAHHPSPRLSLVLGG